MTEVLVLGVIAAVVGYFVVQWFSGKGGVLESATAAGKWVAENIINPAIKPVVYVETTARAAIEGYAAPEVPPTPAGYNVSNWTWTLPDGTRLGLPAGMTPGEFCASSPGSPICAQITAGG